MSRQPAFVPGFMGVHYGGRGSGSPYNLQRGTLVQIVSPYMPLRIHQNTLFQAKHSGIFFWKRA